MYTLTKAQSLKHPSERFLRTRHASWAAKTRGCAGSASCLYPAPSRTSHFRSHTIPSRFLSHTKFKPLPAGQCYGWQHKQKHPPSHTRNSCTVSFALDRPYWIIDAACVMATTSASSSLSHTAKTRLLWGVFLAGYYSSLSRKKKKKGGLR